MIKISIIYPADPAGVISGGIDTFIKGLIKYSPEDIDFELVGITVDSLSRPARKWTRCRLGNKFFDFYPIFTTNNASKRGFVPISLKFTIILSLLKSEISGDVIEFHRIEPSIIFLKKNIPKNLFVHQNMEILKNPSSDILWRKSPKLFYKLEDFLIPKMDSLFTVTESGAKNYKIRYKNLKDKISFIPTWFDKEIFNPPMKEGLIYARKELRRMFEIDSEALVGVFVGRLDSQKDPLLLIEAFSLIADEYSSFHLILIGDGILKKEIQSRLNEKGLNKRVFLAGLMSSQEIGNIHKGADLFLLSSAYEGMPIALLEALGTGLPAVATAVGEVPRVVTSGCNGQLVYERSKTQFADSLRRVLRNLKNYKSDSSLKSVEEYTPEKVLAPVYNNYRKLAKLK